MGIQWIGLTTDCEWAEPMARFYEGLLGLEVRDLRPGGRWAQLFHPDGGVHINIQGDSSYEPPTWPEQPGELTKMMHFEVQVDDVDDAVNRALELGGVEAPWQPPDRNRERLRVMLDPRVIRSAYFCTASSAEAQGTARGKGSSRTRSFPACGP